jgi:hypothetical protein
MLVKACGVGLMRINMAKLRGLLNRDALRASMAVPHELFVGVLGRRPLLFHGMMVLLERACAHELR